MEGLDLLLLLPGGRGAEGLGGAYPGDALIEGVDLRHRELTADILDRALDAVVTSQACDINAARCDEEFWDGVGEGAVGVPMLRHRLGDIEQGDTVAALDAPEDLG